ncbi:hypothetical protein JVU11DRAFT_8314 [Chiua virens]|nr:hypothetical protein JVU11DRAFT_8314 [Chiua virens]
METYWIFHLAASWRSGLTPSPALNPRFAAGSLFPIATSLDPESALTAPPVMDTIPRPSIRAAAVQMVFASRSSREFITPELVTTLEAWCGQAVLEALCAMDIPLDVCINGLVSVARPTDESLYGIAIASSRRKCLELGG